VRSFRVYWCCGGDLVCAGGLALTPADAAALLALHLDEARAAAKAGDAQARADAAQLARELAGAVSEAGRWRRASVFFASR